MVKHKLVIHVGMPKTGSSSLQRFLAMNADVLLRHGWSYPDTVGNFLNETVETEGRWINGGLYPFVLGHLEEKTNWKADYEFFIKTVDDYFQNSNVILSEENIWIYTEGIEFLSFLKERYHDVEVIVYLRRQDEEIVSMHSQLVKSCDMLHGLNLKESIISTADFAKDIVNGKSQLSDMLDYKTVLAGLESGVGERNLYVFIYDEVRHCLKEHFVNWLGIDYGEFIETENVNVTNDNLAIEAKRRFNKVIQHNPHSIIRYLDQEYRSLM